MPWATMCKTCGNRLLAVAEPDEASLMPRPAIPAPSCPFCGQRLDMDVPAGYRSDTVRLFLSEPCLVCESVAEQNSSDAEVQGYGVVCPLPDGCGEFYIAWSRSQN